MGREACPLLFSEAPVASMSQVLELYLSTLISMKSFSGGYCEEATPDPIPNSEVKLLSADGTA